VSFNLFSPFADNYLNPVSWLNRTKWQLGYNLRCQNGIITEGKEKAKNIKWFYLSGNHSNGVSISGSGGYYLEYFESRSASVIIYKRAGCILMKNIVLYASIITLLLSAACAAAPQSPPQQITPPPQTAPADIPSPVKVTIPPKYTLDQVLVMAKTMSPECQAKKGEPTGH
jgi:hypothetical protein